MAMQPLGVVDNLVARLSSLGMTLEEEVHRASNRTDHAWDRAAAQLLSVESAAELRVAVLGTSVTSGCFSGEPPLNVRRGLQKWQVYFNASIGSCAVDRSWSRWLQCELQRRLQQHVQLAHATVRLHVTFRNAASASYFAQCSRQKVPRDADVIVLDVASACSVEELPNLDRALRRAAPRALIVLASWRAKSQVMKSNRMKAATDRLDLLANSLGWDVVRAECAGLRRPLRVHDAC